MSGEEQEVCRAFRNNGSCRFGDECKFEHSEGEAIAPPEGIRERGECFNFRDDGDCTHGDRCRFTHGPDDDRHHLDITEEVCRNYQRGRCTLGDACRRKHEGPVVEKTSGGRGGGRTRSRGACFAFRDEGYCERGEECQFSHGGDEGASAPRSTRSRGACYDYQEGNCERGDGCRFSHEPAGEGDEQQAPRERRRRGGGGGGSAGQCFAFRDEGECERGDECRFAHGEQAGNSAPRPRGACYDFQDGTCERGDECRFSHDASADAGAARPPVKKIDEVCNNFKEGRCRRGDRCPRIHE